MAAAAGPTGFSPGSPVTKGRSPRPPPYTPGSASVAFDAVASALEQDLDMERRELRDQVSFLTRVHAQEKELLLQRNASLEKQFVDARETWNNERKLLSDRLRCAEAAAASTSAELVAASSSASRRADDAEVAAERLRCEEAALASRLDAERQGMETDAARWTGSVEMLRSTIADLEGRLETAQRQATVAQERAEAAERASSAASTAERSAEDLARAKFAEMATRLSAVEAESEHAGVASRERLDIEVRALSHAREELAGQHRKFGEEVRSLRGEAQQWQMAHARQEHESQLRLQRLQADMDKRVAHVRHEFQEEGREAMLQAMLQLQMADDCMQSLHQRKLQEVSANESVRRELEDLRQQAHLETSVSQRLTSSLSESQVEQSTLLRKLRAAEEELQAERLARAASDRRQALALVELQRRAVGSRAHAGCDASGTDYLDMSPLLLRSPISSPLARKLD